MSAVATKTPINLDFTLEDDDDDEPPKPSKPVTIAGEEFLIRQDINAFQVARLSDEDQVAAAMTQILLDAVPEDDKGRLVKTLAGIPNLTPKKLGRLFSAVVEAAAGGHPTNSSADSKPSTAKKVAVRRSAARSSARG